MKPEKKIMQQSRKVAAKPATPAETPEQEIARLRAENAKLKAQGGGAEFRLKVSEKGAVSIYGMGRFPVTLYQEQWLRILDHAVEIREFISDNADDLKAKGE